MQAVLTEKRTVRDSKGKQFQCTYKLNYNTKTVSKTKTKVTCTPKATGKTVVESFYVEALAKQAVITHTIKKGKGTISKISLEECEKSCNLPNVFSFKKYSRHPHQHGGPGPRGLHSDSQLQLPPGAAQDDVQHDVQHAGAGGGGGPGTGAAQQSGPRPQQQQLHLPHHRLPRRPDRSPGTQSAGGTPGYSQHTQLSPK